MPAALQLPTLGEGGHQVINGPCLPGSSVTAACPALRVTRTRGMVVVTGQNKATGCPGDAMSSSDAEDDFQEPATPTATQAEHSLALLPQQVSDPKRDTCPKGFTVCRSKGVHTGRGWK